MQEAFLDARFLRARRASARDGASQSLVPASVAFAFDFAFFALNFH
jgi:hypothetical protein